MKLLNVQQLVDSQSQLHKERLLSQFSRLLDSTPSFPIYYSIDGVNSSTEFGTRDVQNYVASDSPVKFKKILNMPMYALNVITAPITFDEVAGAYTEYDDQSLVLNSVLRPLPGDHFILPEFNPEVIFAVTNVTIRAIRGQDHYVIDFSVMPNSRILNIERQVVETYETLFRNIGTENTVLIKQDDYNRLNEYTDAYGKITERYIDEFYDEELSYLKTPDEISDSIGYGTCKYLMKFLITNRIIYFDEILNLVFAFELVLPFEARHNKLYAQTFPLNPFVKKVVPSLKNVYTTFKSLPISLFTQVKDAHFGQTVEFLSSDNSPELTTEQELVYSKTFPTMIQAETYTSDSVIENVIAKFINDADITVAEFISTIDDYSRSDLFRMYFLPMILFILKLKISALQLISK